MVLNSLLIKWSVIQALNSETIVAYSKGKKFGNWMEFGTGPFN